jgi:hypothetical protein
MYEGDDLNFDDEETPPEESSNRTFLIAAGILGGIVLLSIACLAGYALIILPQQRAAQQTGEQNALATQNAQVNDALTATGVAFDLSQTPQATVTFTLTNTPVVAQPTETNTPEITETPDPAITQTLAVEYTQLAESTATIILTTTALPTSGFADEVGLPGLVIAAMVLVAVIFLARRLRASPTN